MSNFKIVVIESPYAGEIKKNVRYAQLCMQDCLRRSEAPYASHLLYTQPNVLDDTNAEEREIGIQAGFAFKHLSGMHTVFYTDLGVTDGMSTALDYLIQHKMSYEFRELLNYEK